VTQASNSRVLLVLGLAIALAPIGVAKAQDTTPATKGTAAPSVAEKTNIEALRGAWFGPMAAT